MGETGSDSIGSTRNILVRAGSAPLVSDQSTRRFRVIGVDRESATDRELEVEAWNEANARVKAELLGLVVTAVTPSQMADREYPAAEGVRNSIEAGEAAPEAPAVVARENSASAPAITKDWVPVHSPDLAVVQAVLDGTKPGQVRDGVLFMLADNRIQAWNTPPGDGADSHFLLTKEHPYRAILLKGVLAGQIPASWGTTDLGTAGWLVRRSDLWVEYEHSLLPRELQPHPQRWNWAAFALGGIWAIWTRTWQSLWFSAVGTAAYFWKDHLMSEAGRRWTESEEAPSIYFAWFCVIAARLLYAPFANRMRHDRLTARGFRVRDYVSGRTKDEARSRMAQGLSAAQAKLECGIECGPY